MGQYKTPQGGRGHILEDMINATNTIYRNKGIAMVQKIPTPITPIKMDAKGHITFAFFAEKSSVDYVGVAQGTALCFDAKECATDTFPLKNIHQHQVNFMNDFSKQGGVSFLILFYPHKDVLYYMPLAEVNQYMIRATNGGRKSIAFDELESTNIFHSEDVPVPYLQFVHPTPT